MNEKTPERNLAALNAGIAKSCLEADALADGLQELAARQIDESSVDREHPQEGPAHGDNGHGEWAKFRHRLDAAGVRGEKVAKGLAEEIERHPLIGGLVAFGLGFAIARLLFRRSK